MSAGIAVKPRCLPPLDVHEEQPSISGKTTLNGLTRDPFEAEEHEEVGETGSVRKGTFLFGNSLRIYPEIEELDLSECTSEESLTPEMGDDLKKIQEVEIEPEEEPDLSNPKMARWLKEELRRRLVEEQRESDQRWIVHEKEQIRHLQDSHEFMLKFLHKEVDRFQTLYKDAKRPALVVHETEEVKELKAKVTLYEEAIKQLEEQMRIKKEHAEDVETKVKLTIDRLKEQNDLQAERIRQMSSELNDRNQTVAHLSAQLRNYRLRDAMATAQQRRRASQGSPVLSPTSPSKPFPSKGVVSSSVSITYPGSKSMTMSAAGESFEGPGSIERPPRRRAASGFGK